MMRSIGFAVVSAAAMAIAGYSVWSPQRVGDRNDRGIVVPTGQRVLGGSESTVFGGRPVDLVVDRTRGRLFVKENRGLTVLNLTDRRVIREIPVAGGASLTGLALSDDGKTLWYSDAAASVHVFDLSSPTYAEGPKITFPTPKVGGAPYPCGIVSLGANRFAVALSRSNAVALVDAGKIEELIPVDVAPFSLAKVGDKVFVTCWGRPPSEGDLASPSSGSPVQVDRRGIAKGGSLVEIDLGARRVTRRASLGAQPSGIAIRDRDVWVTEAGSDRITAIDRLTFQPKGVAKFSVGDAPTAIQPLSDGRWAVALGGANKIAILKSNGQNSGLELRAGWYPVALTATPNELLVANAKGTGSRRPTEPNRGLGVYDFSGSISGLSVDDALKPPPQAVALLPRRNQPARAVPERVGEPSLIKHVVYVLKENRTYDQVFGDMKQGDGDPRLCVYPAKITPNHHALASEFGLLDNFYCNGVLSADGHSWATEANATSYFERSFGGWTRSYPYGDDPIAISQTGHIWDNVLDHGLSFRNYGEYDYADPSKKESYRMMLADLASGSRQIRFKHKFGLARLQKYSNPDYPGWNMEIPDVVRADIFVREFRQLDAAGKVPNFSFVYLPQDHTSGDGAGAPSPESHMADNDLALGRVVEAVSHSKAWKNTCIFVTEDDPQAGFDHVDGHRSLCLVISPYSRRRSVVREFYNQAGVLRTAEAMLGLPTMGKFDAMANLMSACFSAKPDLRPYVARPNQVPLDKMNPTKSAHRLNLSRPDLLDEDQFNRQLWALSRQSGRPYPADLAGAHGNGLARRGLRSAEPESDEDDLEVSAER